MDFIILIIICLCLIVHRELSSYQEFGLLPNQRSFLLYTIIFNIIAVVCFIWLFGIYIGIIISLLTFFQITYSTFLWPFLIFGTLNRKKKVEEYGVNFSFLSGYVGDDFTTMQDELENFRPNKIVNYSWSWLVIILTLLTFLNFFIGEFSSLKQKLLNFSDGSYWKLIFYAAVIIAIGNALRILMIKLIIK